MGISVVDGVVDKEAPLGTVVGSTSGLNCSAGELKTSILRWVDAVTANRASLLEVNLRLNPGDPMISIPHLCTRTGLDISSVWEHKDLTTNVLEAMCAQKIVLSGYSSLECEWRRKLLQWYERMPEDQKKEIPFFGGGIKGRGYLDTIPSLLGLGAVRRLPLVTMTLDEIVDDLRLRGFASEEYKSVNQRVAEKKLGAVKPEESTYAKFVHYRNLTVNCFEDLGRGDGEPFAPLMHLFGYASLGVHSKSGISNYMDSYRYYRADLLESGFEGHEPITEMVGTFSLVRYRKYLESLMIEGKSSSHTCNTALSAVRKVMEASKDVAGLLENSYVRAPGFDVSSETHFYRPYSPAERSRIADEIGKAIAYTNNLAKPYVPSGLGEDPVGRDGGLKPGYRTLENARWIFENRLGCVPIGFKTADKTDPYHKAFIAIISQQPKAIGEIYADWGVLYSRDSHMLTPYLARLSQVTGLNADSLLGLDIEDFEERHKLTNRSCLRYWKERSTGAKEYHLDIFFADISWLTTSQAREVKKIFDDVIELTKGFRSRARPEVARRLFIYQASSPRFFEQVRCLEEGSSITSKMFEIFSKQHSLLGDDGEELRISPARFRPSFVSELVERGVSLREVQVILGHRNIRTTISYLDRLDLNRVARSVLDEALKNLHAATVLAEPSTPVTKSQALAEDIIFKTPFGGCRNIFNPPDFIKNLRNYIPGKPCALYNKCLSCDNRLLTKAHLPELFSMRRDYLSMLETSRVIDTPYGAVVLENLALLEEILDPNMSDFSSAELDEAKRLSEYIETSVVVEGVVM